MMVSIIVPVYNVEQYLADCLASVAAQTYDGRMECLVVDDCGTDRSMDVARRFIEAYKGPVNFRIINREANGGLSAARNSGLDAATGDCVYFLDSDDELTPDAIKVMVEAMAQNRCDVVIADYRTEPWSNAYPKNHVAGGSVFKGIDVLDIYCRNMIYMMAVNKLYSTAFLKNMQMRFAEGLLHEDELWSFQCAARAESVCVIDSICYIYKVRPGSIMTSKSQEQRRARCLWQIAAQIALESAKHTERFSPDVHHFVQHKCMVAASFSSSVLPISEQRAFYRDYRRSLVSPGLIKRLKIDGKSLRRHIRDSHLLFPPAIGHLWLRLCLKIQK